MLRPFRISTLVAISLGLSLGFGAALFRPMRQPEKPSDDRCSRKGTNSIRRQFRHLLPRRCWVFQRNQSGYGADNAIEPRSGRGTSAIEVASLPGMPSYLGCPQRWQQLRVGHAVIDLGLHVCQLRFAGGGFCRLLGGPRAGNFFGRFARLHHFTGQAIAHSMSGRTQRRHSRQ